MANKEEKKKVKNITKEGLLYFKKSNKKWSENQYYFVLTGSSLHFYKHPQDPKPTGSFVLDKSSSIADEPNAGRPNSLLISSDSDKHAVAAEDQEEAALWKEALKNSTGKEPQPPPEKDEGGDSLLFRFQKGVASKAVSSGIGKKMMKQMLPKEFNDTLEDIRIVAEKKAGSKQAKEIQNAITKLLVKAFFQVDKNNLTVEDFMGVLVSLDEALELLSVVTQNYSSAKPEQLQLAFSKVEGLIKTLEGEVMKIMLPYMKPKNQVKIKSALETLGNSKFLSEVWADDKLREEQLTELCLLYKTFTPKKMRRKTTVWREIFPRKEEN